MRRYGSRVSRIRTRVLEVHGSWHPLHSHLEVPAGEEPESGARRRSGLEMDTSSHVTGGITKGEGADGEVKGPKMAPGERKGTRRRGSNGD